MASKVQILIAAKNLAGGAIDSTRAGLDRLKLSAMGVKNALFSVQGMLMGIGLGIGAAEVSRFFFQVNRTTQSLLAQLKVLEGTEKAAKRTFDAIQAHAIDTPFKIEEVTQAYIRLRTSGIMPTEDMLTSFGDLASARGKSIDMLAMAIEDAVTGEMERLKEFGIVARAEGNKIETVYNGQRKTIERTSEAIIDYMVEVGKSSVVQGAQEEQMSTLNGEINKLFNSLSLLAQVIGEEGGVNEEIIGATESVTDLTNSVMENSSAVSAWARLVVAAMKAFAQSLIFPVRLLFNLGQIIGRTIETILYDINFLVLSVVDTFLAGYNFIVRQANKIPGVNLSEAARITDQAEFWWESAKAASADVLRQTKDILNSVKNLGGAYGEVASAIAGVANAQESIRAGVPSLPTGNGSGGGDGGGQGGAGSGGPTPDVTGFINGGLSGPATAGMAGPVTLPVPPSFGQRIAEEMQLALGPARELEETIGYGLIGAMYGFGDAVSAAFSAFVSGSESAGEAFESAMLGALSAVSKSLGDHYLAKAAAAVADGLAGNPAGFAAAGKFTLAATMMYALAGGIGGAAAGGGGVGGGGGSAAGYQYKETNDLSGSGKGSATLVVQGGFLDMNDPAQEQAFARALEELSGRRVIVRGTA